MVKDPIIEEIRRIRLEIEAECQHDPDILYEHMCQFQEQYRDRLVRRSPQPALIPSSMPLPEQAHKGDPKASAT
ncbi:MAG: hypothetical protein GDA43_04940 [Hormoscilla sp. SP5CHS1]|nr:hypothetical protein [Hormoscilla sp. SP12CHS1]MBC6452613.1 hypothetical protein [Hormoscilla sp. SP5CHS1]MBC6475131.1 hypothetical protein [Hormoscilla sp. GM102CHS1]